MSPITDFRGAAKRLESIDIPRIGSRIGVGEDELHAFMEVEANGSGFDSKGRPKMLFEPHVFWRELGPGPKRDRAAAEGLAYPRWKPRAYPKDSYPRLQKAMAIDEEAALRSASWGLGQIMGFNARAAGYASAKAMVLAFLDDEEHHLRAMIRFIETNGLDDELRRHDWAGFARGYNGPGFAKNGYHKNLAASFARWQKIKDTPIPAAVPAPARPEPPAAAPQSAAGAAAVGGQTPAAVQRTPITAPPSAYVAAVMAVAYAAWEWGAGVVDWLTFWD
jgi:hypothetical protein